MHTDGPSLRMSFFASPSTSPSGTPRRLTEGRRGIFLGKVGRFRDEWQLTNPQMVLFGDGGEDAAELSLETLRAFYPIYPLTKGVDSWDLQRAVAFALTVVDDVPDLLPGRRPRASTTCSTPARALELVHAPGTTTAEITSAQRRFRFEEALVTQLVLARRRRAVRELGAQARTGDQGALLAAFDAAAAVRAHRRPARDRRRRSSATWRSRTR